MTTHGLSDPVETWYELRCVDCGGGIRIQKGERQEGDFVVNNKLGVTHIARLRGWKNTKMGWVCHQCLSDPERG